MSAAMSLIAGVVRPFSGCRFPLAINSRGRLARMNAHGCSICPHRLWPADVYPSPWVLAGPHGVLVFMQFRSRSASLDSLARTIACQWTGKTVRNLLPATRDG